MKTRYFALLATIALLAPQGANAQEPGLFDRLDTNKDGSVTADEVDGDKKRLFDRLLKSADKNGDGKLDKEEFAAGTKSRGPRRRPQAQGDGERKITPEAVLRRLDGNNDGKISKEEARGPLSENFDRVDANRDGAIDRTELQRAIAGRGNQPGQRPGDTRQSGGDSVLKTLDTNGDGQLSAEEIAAAAKSLAKLDRDNDGKLSRQELAQRRGQPQGNRRPQGGKINPEQILKRIMQADANGDGKISKDEAPDRLRQNFDRVDGNGDGQLDRAELTKMFERIRAAGGRRPGNKSPKK